MLLRFNFLLFSSFAAGMRQIFGLSERVDVPKRVEKHAEADAFLNLVKLDTIQ